MARRSLKEAVENSPQLEAFVFGRGVSNETAPANILQLLPRNSVNLTFSFTRDRKPLRHYYDREELEKWVEADIRVNGIQSPLWVRPMPGDSTNKYELVAGLRRYLAAEILDLDSIPAIVYDWSDEEAYIASLSENINRRSFSVLEQLDGTLNLLAIKLDTTLEGAVQALYRLNNEVKKVNQNVLVSDEYEIVESTFNFLGQISWRSFVSTRLPLLKKPPEILQAIREGKIEYTKALEIAKVKDEQERQELLQLAICDCLSLTQIKQYILKLAPKSQQKASTPQDRFSDTYKRIKAAKVWEDPKKAKQLERLMAQLEQLL